MFRSGGPEFDAAADFDPSTQGIGGWHYLYDASGAGTYASLTVGSTYWGFQAWRNATCTEASVRAGTGELLVVPPSVGTCDGWTTLAWEAPSAGGIDFAVSVEEVDACGSGVAFELRDAAGNLLYNVADTAWGVTYEHADSMDVDAGDRLYLRVGQGPGGSWCDTTAVSFQVDHSVETNLIIDPTYDNDNDDHSDWFDTGITVTGGRQLDITATGLANNVPSPDTKYDADGTDTTPPQQRVGRRAPLRQPRRQDRQWRPLLRGHQLLDACGCLGHPLPRLQRLALRRQHRPV